MSFTFILSCTSYDNAVIYHKNFVSGTYPLLRFDGYYSDTLGPKIATIYSKPVKHVFLYANGSVFSAGRSVQTNSIVGTFSDEYSSWGNYLIGHDTITIERFEHDGGNYSRVILKGIIKQNEIRLFSRKRRRDKQESIGYSLIFSPYSPKPDSTKNFTRIWPKYNK